MKYVLIVAFMWHQVAAPLDITIYLRTTIEQCSHVCTALFCNNARANFVIASAAITAGVTSFCFFLKKTLQKIHATAKKNIKSPNPPIQITQAGSANQKASMSPTQRKSSPSSSILLSPTTTPLSSRPASRRNSRNAELYRHALSTIEEEEGGIELLRSLYTNNDRPLSQEQIDAILKIPDISTSPAEIKPIKTLTAREKMLEQYHTFPVDASPIEWQTKTGIYWLGWNDTQTAGIRKLTLSYNGDEIEISEPRLMKSNND